LAFVILADAAVKDRCGTLDVTGTYRVLDISQIQPPVEVITAI